MSFRAWVMLATALGLVACNSQPTSPPPSTSTCLDADSLYPPEGVPSQHKAEKISFRPAAMAGITWAPGDSVSAFFGSSSVRLVVAQATSLFLIEWGSTGAPQVYELDQGDESPTGGLANFSNPQFSPDGNWIAYSAQQGAQGFALNVASPSASSWRIPLSTTGYYTADPHWLVRNGKPWIYFDNTENTVGYTAACAQFDGHTYRVALENDSTIDSLQTTGLPGIFRGGLSRDGVWAGTAYSPAGLYNTTTPTVPPILLAGQQQKCNPSMNPFPAGSVNADFLMLLGFGGSGIEYHTPIDSLTEAEHQNLWIHDKQDLIIWQGKLPDASRYYLWDKPRWSTDPLFATSVTERPNESQTSDCDLYAVKLPDLTSASRDTLYQAQGYLRLGSGGFNTGTYSHLWVGP